MNSSENSGITITILGLVLLVFTFIFTTIHLNGEINVIVELPGVAKESIKLRGTEEKLIISVNVPNRKYYKEIDMPTKVDPKNAQTSFKNGVLEVTMKKIEKKSSGEEIKID